VALLQGLVQNEGDGWQWTLEELDRYYESTASVRSSAVQAATEPDAVAPEAREHAGIYLDAAAVLGRRTAEMHLALASRPRRANWQLCATNWPVMPRTLSMC
jgi:maltose alpha-D-glucosyltransferase/alpha-amylase